MRIRSIMPKFYRSDDIDALDWHTRLVFIGLWSYVDDNGVGLDKLSSITSDLFAHDLSVDPTETLRRVSLALDVLDFRGMITRYAVAGKALLFVNTWDDYQRVKNPGVARYERPTSVNDGSPESLRTSSVDPTETLPPGEGEKGRRGEGLKEVRPPFLNGTSPAPARKAGGMELARQLNTTARSVEAYDIAAAYSNSLTTPIETGLLTKVGTEIDKCLRASIPPPAIAAGLQAWTSSDSWSPNQIPTFVHKAAARAAPGNGQGKPTQKAVSYADAAEQLLAQVRTL